MKSIGGVKNYEYYNNKPIALTIFLKKVKATA